MGTDEDDNKEGAWTSTIPEDLLETTEDKPDGKSILPNLNDGVCICETLEISPEILNIPGLRLLCEKTLPPEGIQSDNACALLCDSHFRMYIECYRGKWKNTAQYPFEDVTAEKIKC